MPCQGLTQPPAPALVRCMLQCDLGPAIPPSGRRTTMAHLCMQVLLCGLVLLLGCCRHRCRCGRRCGFTFGFRARDRAARLLLGDCSLHVSTQHVMRHSLKRTEDP